MNKPKLYLETTIPSYLTARPSRDLVIAAHQQITHEWWSQCRTEYELRVSQYVLDEASGGDAEFAKKRMELLGAIALITTTDPAIQLAATIMKSGILPAKAAGDAVHIAMCATNLIEYLLTWNCAHLANAHNRKQIERLCLENGFACPTICTPEELLGPRT